jgi:hypothetical protein
MAHSRYPREGLMRFTTEVLAHLGMPAEDAALLVDADLVASTPTASPTSPPTPTT